MRPVVVVALVCWASGAWASADDLRGERGDRSETDSRDGQGERNEREESEGGSGERCSHLIHAFLQAPDRELPELTRGLISRTCATALPCADLLGRRLPQLDTLQVEQAIAQLKCLQPVDPSFLVPPQPPDSIIVGDSPVRGAYVTSQGVLMVSFDGTTFTPAPGRKPLPATFSWTASQVLRLGLLGELELLAGNTQGLWFTPDGGLTWAFSSGPGSGLEATSQNVGALIIAITPSATIDVLVGMVGAANGGVYLSGDGGEHWTQINQGFNPTTLNLSTLIRTSCSTCAVQYYSGTYGSGVYTLTIPVLVAPAVTGWCFGSTSCACGTSAPSGPTSGGQPLRLCGSNFRPLATAQFGPRLARTFASGCSVASSTVMTCTSTPGGAPGPVPFGVLNADTRAGTAAIPYSYGP